MCGISLQRGKFKPRSLDTNTQVQPYFPSLETLQTEKQIGSRFHRGLGRRHSGSRFHNTYDKLTRVRLGNICLMLRGLGGWRVPICLASKPAPLGRPLKDCFCGMVIIYQPLLPNGSRTASFTHVYIVRARTALRL